MVDLSFLVEGSTTPSMIFGLGSCCGNIHDGVSIEYGKHGPVVLSKEDMFTLMEHVREYYNSDKKCRSCLKKL